MAGWVTSLLAVTGQCCIAATRTNTSREEEEEEEEEKESDRKKEEDDGRQQREGKTTAHVQLFPRHFLPSDNQAAKHLQSQ